MSRATARGYRVAFLAEVTQGTTPVTAPTLLRTTGGGMSVAASSVESEEAQLFEVPDVIRTNVEGTGTINFEYSYGGIHGLLEGLFGATWTTNVLRVGSTLRTFTIEDQFTDISRFLTARGCIIESISITLQQGSKITGTITYRALTPPTSFATATAFGAAPNAAPTSPIMSPVGSVQLIQEAGALNLGPAGIGTLGMTINMTRQGIAMPQVGTTALAGLDQGTFVCTGTLSLYVPIGATAIIDKYLSDTATQLALTLGGASTLRDAYLFSNVKFTEGGIGEMSRNSPANLNLSWQALASSPNTTVQITRTP
ncbi:MAG: phage tail tube protein [Gemmatimonas sp.]|jgi:hypothetical protein|uniref:phage tail tube protein n=1 Tax=Gemmatimonas sp. TaxID=1962908 RepID=UPI00391FB025